MSEIEPAVDRSNMDIEFYGLLKPKTFEVSFGNHKIEFTPDNHYIIFYRKAPEYSRICYTDSEGNYQRLYDMPDLINWMIGFKWDEHHTEMVRNRDRDSMYDLCGWTSDVLIKDRPDPEEKAEYELLQCYDLYPAIGELSVEQIIEIGRVDDGDQS